MKLRFAAIRRKTEYSPNHVINDSAIIEMTAEALRREGALVTMYDEGTITAHSIPEKVILSMAQGPTGSRSLVKIEQGGALIINSPVSVMNCYRTAMVQILPGAGIPFPRSVIVSTDDGAGFTMTGPAAGTANGPKIGSANGKTWVKRGDVHAVHKEDVSLATSVEERGMLLKEFHARDIAEAVLQEHVDGDTVKFYAVRNSDLFHWYYLNGAHNSGFDPDALRRTAAGAAEALGLYVYGGDAIIGPDGVITIIDINDWPSFAPVRERASAEIARLATAMGRKFLK